jgi:hypothetical protein
MIVSVVMFTFIVLMGDAILLLLAASFTPFRRDHTRQCLVCNKSAKFPGAAGMAKHLCSAADWDMHADTVLAYSAENIQKIEALAGHKLPVEDPAVRAETRALRESFGVGKVNDGGNVTLYRYCKICNPTGSVHGKCIKKHLTSAELHDHWKEECAEGLQKWEHQRYVLRHFPLAKQLDLLAYRAEHEAAKEAADAAKAAEVGAPPPPVKDPADVAREKLMRELLGQKGLLGALAALERGDALGADRTSSRT